MEQSPATARDLTLHPTQIEESLYMLLPKNDPPLEFTLSDFPPLPEWDQTKCLVIHGPTNSFKTTIAVLLLKNMGHLCSHVEDIRTYNPKVHSGLIFDDMNFIHWPRESRIHLTDTKYRRTIHCRYKNCSIPAGTPRIFTTNLLPMAMLTSGDPAIIRRCTSWFVERDPRTGRITIKVEF